MTTVRPRKRLGQHFLRDPNVIAKIVASIRPDLGDRVVEIGPGLGAITEPLLMQSPDMIAVEIDERAVEELRARFPTLDVRHQDVLKMSWTELAEADRRLYVVGNLPYNITTPILFSLYDIAPSVNEVVVMMQLEVARRLVAVPRTKAYGILSVATQLVGLPEILFRVSRHVFEPKPAVESAVVRIRFVVQPEDDSGTRDPAKPDAAFVRTVIRTAFNQRRKTLRNSLAGLLSTDRPLPDTWSGKRAEELPPSEFVELARFLKR
jgi:16S rRNA (adenine1518-N6/adenine1519-N6)-dimethyltransferase